MNDFKWIENSAYLTDQKGFLSITGLWPRQQPRPTKSTAEHSVYNALSKQLPAHWLAWHSLRIRTENGLEGEGDFIIAIPDRGFLVLEVKGGAIEQRDGRWFQNSYLAERLNAKIDNYLQYL